MFVEKVEDNNYKPKRSAIEQEVIESIIKPLLLINEYKIKGLKISSNYFDLQEFFSIFT